MREAGAAPRLFSAVIVGTAADELHVQRALESLCAQDIGCAEHIETVVADTSQDGCVAEALERAEPQPQACVACVRAPGLSWREACERALGQCTGRYVAFMHADATFSHGAFRRAARFFERRPDVRIACARTRFKGGGTLGTLAQTLEQGYERGRTADLREEDELTFVSPGGMWVARELCAGLLAGQGAPHGAEELVAVNTLLAREPVCGVLKFPVYRRAARGPVPTLAPGEPALSEELLAAYAALADAARACCGSDATFVQRAVLLDVCCRLAAGFAQADGPAHGQCVRSCHDALAHVEERVIARQHGLTRAQRLTLLACKRGQDVPALQRALRVHDADVCLAGADGAELHMWSAADEARVRFEFLSLDGDALVLEGRLHTLLDIARIRVVAQCADGVQREADVFARPDVAGDGLLSHEQPLQHGFTLRVPAAGFRVHLFVDGRDVACTFRTGKFFPSGAHEHSYCTLGRFSVTREGGAFRVEPRSRVRAATRERALVRELRADGADEQLVAERRHVLDARVRARPGRELWLVCDRPTFAGDNGEALFRHLMAHPQPDVDVRFVLAPTSADYARLCAVGPVVDYGSSEHRHLLACADKLVSSQADECVISPFPELAPVLDGLPAPTFVFLQHGIIMDDLSQWLRRWNKNVALLCTTWPAERRSIVGNARYGYPAHIVQLTGLARHDTLLTRAAGQPPERRLLIAPTWRSAHALPVDADTGARPYNPKLKHTEYFAFYDALLHDGHIEAAVREHGFSACFLLHQAFSANICDFTSSYCDIAAGYSYRDELARAAVMLTDYSSVSTDFALLRKPVLYAQFDEELFFATQRPRGYFDYDADGFGPVCTSYERTVEALLALMEHPVMDEEYRRRADAFFVAADGHACERIVEAICALDVTTLWSAADSRVTTL